MTAPGLTRDKLPFFSLPRKAAPNGYIRPSQKYGTGHHTYRGGSTGRPPKKDKVVETQPKPEPVCLPGEPKPKSTPKKGSKDGQKRNKKSKRG